MMVARQQNRLLPLLHPEAGVAHVEIVRSQIAGLSRRVAPFQVNAVLRGEVLFGLERGDDLFEVVVGALPMKGVVGNIRRVTGVAEEAVLHGGLRPVAAAQIFGVGTEAEPVPLEQFAVFLLRDVGGEGAGARVGEEIANEVFVQRRGFVAQVDAAVVAQGVVAVGQEQVRGKISVVRVHSTGGFAQAHVRHAGVRVDAGEIRAPHRPVLVEQEPRAIDAAIVVQLLRFFEVIDPLVDPALLLLDQRRIEPRGWVSGIELLRQRQLVQGAPVVARVAEGFAEVAAQSRPVRLEGGGHLEVLLPRLRLAAANAAQPASEPGIAQRPIKLDRLLKISQRRGNFILGGQQKSFQRQRLGVARREPQTFLHRLPGRPDPAKTELHLRHPRPREAKLGRSLRRLPRGAPRRLEPRLRLLVIGLGEPLRCQRGRPGGGGVLLFHCRHQFAQRVRQPPEPIIRRHGGSEGSE